MPRAQFPHQLEIAGLWQVQAGVGRDRFHDDGGDFLSVARKDGAQGVGIIKRQGEGEPRQRSRDAGAVGLPVGERAAAGLDQQRVDMAVVASLKLDEFVATGEAARKADATHGRLGAAVDHANLLDARHPFANGPRHLELVRIGNAEAHAARGRVRHGLEHHLRRVPENGRAPRADKIEQLAAVEIIDF